MGAYDPEAQARRNADVVRRLTAALATRDAAAVVSLLAEDIVYHFPGANPMAGTYRGRDAVMDFFRRFPTMLGAVPVADTHDVLASEAHGADLTTFRVNAGDRDHTWRTVRIDHLAEDRVFEVFVMIEDQAAFDAFVEGTG